ncbi:MAG: 5-oxoprolinase subunit PxpB [Thermomicrobiales bacterium]
MTDPEPSSPLRVQLLADGGLLVTFGDRIDVALSRHIIALVARLEARQLPGIIDLVPSYTTLLVIIDPITAGVPAIEAAIRDLWNDVTTSTTAETESRAIVIPVLYGGQHGPDLAEVAAHTGLLPAEVVARHAGGEYVIGALGFAPGFAYLIGLPPELTTPRRGTPRTAVPSGSVGIGGNQTGVYALPTPGGWSLIGRTPLRLFQPERTEPFRLRAGDTVRFEPIDAARFADLAAAEAETPPASVPDHIRPAAFKVVAGGLQTTVQDLGRPGRGRFGVSPGGAADRGALIAANRLAGNRDGDAALEITLLGPHLRVLRPCRLALAGADLGARINGRPLAPGTVAAVYPGDDIRFEPSASHAGARAYLAVRGGFDVPVVMGSRSTDLTAAIGGWQGRALQAGDLLSVGDATPTNGDQSARPRRPRARRPAQWRAGHGHEPHIVRIVRGPQADRFPEETWRSFLKEAFTVSSQSNRLGLRLDGPPLVPIASADIISEGIVTGAIQITNNGQPIVMLPARATIGGYAKIATVIAADLDLLGQVKPGDRLRFVEVSTAEAFRVARDGERTEPGTWREVMTVIDEFGRHDLETLDLTLPAERIRLRLHRG